MRWWEMRWVKMRAVVVGTVPGGSCGGVEELHGGCGQWW